MDSFFTVIFASFGSPVAEVVPTPAAAAARVEIADEATSVEVVVPVNEDKANSSSGFAYCVVA